MQIQKNRNISLFLENQDMERGKKNAWKISRIIIISNIWTEMFIYFKTFHVLSLIIR